MIYSMWVHSHLYKCPNFILFYSWLKFHYIYMYHIFFIHSSVNGNLGCFRILVIVNNASVNPGVHASFSIMAFSVICPAVGLVVGHMVVLFLAFLRKLHYCSGEGNGNLLQYSPESWILWTEEPGGLLSIESDMTEVTLACMHTLEEEMAPHSNILAQRIPGTEQPGGLSSMGLHRVGHDWSDLAAAAHYCSS